MIYHPTHFELKELVCPHIFEKFGDIAWSFFDNRLLLTLDFIRDKLALPIYINNWDMEGEFSQRGFRCIQCSLVQDAIKKGILYVSPHMTGQAVDFDVMGLVAEEVRYWIMKNQNILPYPVRLEDKVPWVHLDIRNAGKGKVYLFNN